MAVRALIYHGLLVYKYKPPVMSVIIYPFEGNTVQSPYQETNGDGEAITFHFRVLPLWKLDARKYLNDRDICMHALIPAMSGATREMHIQALEKMIKYFQEKNDEDELREHLLCFGVLMRRAKQLPMADIEEVLKRMKAYDQLIEEDDYLMALVEERSEALAEQKAEAASRAMLKAIIEARFPRLVRALAHEVVLPEKREALDVLIVQIAAAPDENVARQILVHPNF